MTGRPRTSTIVVSGLFVAVLALYLLVRPASAAPAQSASRATTPSPTGSVHRPVSSSSPARSPSTSPTQSGPGPARTPNRTSTPGPETTAAPSPSPSLGSPGPGPSPSAASSMPSSP